MRALSLVLALLAMIATSAPANAGSDQLGLRGCVQSTYIEQGVRFATCGDIVYMLDGRTFLPVSDGYHAFVKVTDDPADHDWIAVIGALRYLLRDGREISIGYHTISRLPDGTYRATLGAKEFKLDHDGNVILL